MLQNRDMSNDIAINNLKAVISFFDMCGEIEFEHDKIKAKKIAAQMEVS